MSDGLDDASLAWRHFVSYRDTALKRVLTSPAVSGVFFYLPGFLFILGFLPIWVGDPSEWRWTVILFSALGAPGFLVQVWANRTARYAAATAKPKLVARSRARQLAISMAATFAGIVAALAAVFFQGAPADAFPNWVQGLIAINALGLGALGLLKDQIEDSIDSVEAWKKLPKLERDSARRKAKELLGERVKSLAPPPGPSVRLPEAPRFERLALGLVALASALFRR